jgi:putative tricarboxylic transport membrane protein
VLSDGDLTPFFTRPISAVLFGIIALVVLLRLPAISRLITGRRA